MSHFLQTQRHPATHTRLRRLAVISLVSMSSCITACSGSAALQRLQYDFGLPTSASTTTAQSTLQIGLADIQVTPALDSNAMWYRLQYDNAQQLKTYAQARWSMPPAQLLTQRFKIRLLANGTQILSTGNALTYQSVLHIEIDEFSQIFTTTSASHAQISLRAVLTKGKAIVAQRSFEAQFPCQTADAAGGARAMQEASDILSRDIQQWLTQLAAT